MQSSHAKTVKHVASEKWKDKKKETELSQIKQVQKKKANYQWLLATTA